MGRGHSYIVWVHNAFGPALALLNLFDCALYPLVLAQYGERAPYPLLPRQSRTARTARAGCASSHPT